MKLPALFHFLFVTSNTLFNLFDKNIIIELYQTNGLLLVFFSAVIMGIGLGLAIKSGASTGGVDILFQVLNKYFHLHQPYRFKGNDSQTILEVCLKNNLPLTIFALYFSPSSLYR